MDYQEIAENTFFEVSDLEWFEQWYPECISYIERWWIDDPAFSIEFFGAWDEYLDWCFFYGIDPENNDRAVVFDDASLSGIYVFGLV